MREKLIELIQSAVSGCARYWAGLIADRLIAAGVVVPVRCKECKYYVKAPYYALRPGMSADRKICRHPDLDFDTECADHWIWMNPDDYCSSGERRTDG